MEWRLAFGVNEGKQCNDACTLHGIGEIALLFRSETSEAARQNFAAFGDELLEKINILVIDRVSRLDWKRRFLKKGLDITIEVRVGRLTSVAAHLISLWRVILLSCGQNFISSNLSVVFRRFFSVVYRDTPGERFSEAGTDRHSVHSSVTTIRTPLFLAIKDVAPQLRSELTNNKLTC